MKKFFYFLLLLLTLSLLAYHYNWFSFRAGWRQLWFNLRHTDTILLDNKSVALRQARSVVDDALTAGRIKISDGPCLKEELVPNWSLDLVHEPRQTIDELPANQCQYFLSGRTEKVIEYDVSGNFIGIIEKKK